MVSWDSRMLGLQKLSSPAWWSAVLTVTCLCKFLWPWPFWKLMGELETMCLCRRSTHLSCFFFLVLWSIFSSSFMSSLFCSSFLVFHLFSYSTFFCVFCLVMVDLVFFRVFLSCVCHLDWLWLQVVSADPPAEGKFNFCLALNMLCFMSRKQKVGLCKI